MSLYTAAFAPGVLREIRGLPASIRTDVGHAIWELQQDPRRVGVTKLAGREEQYRYRPPNQGSLRIVFSIIDRVLTITVLKVADRRDVYR